MDSNGVTIAVGLIGSAATISAALITRPRPAPPQPQLRSQPTSQAPPRGEQPTADQGVSYAMPNLKVSKSLWFGIAGIFLWLLPILGYLVTLPGLFTAIRDIRSPGTRRYAWIGLALCMLAFTLTIINSAIGAYQGAHGTGWWQNG